MHGLAGYNLGQTHTHTHEFLLIRHKPILFAIHYTVYDLFEYIIEAGFVNLIKSCGVTYHITQVYDMSERIVCVK